MPEDSVYGATAIAFIFGGGITGLIALFLVGFWSSLLGFVFGGLMAAVPGYFLGAYLDARAKRRCHKQQSSS
jgi:uncharacterized membrane protein YedE/YeeE